VEGADEREVAAVARIEAEQPQHAAAHFAGGFVGEGDGQNVGGPHMVFGH
jgi:hypothetical protein